MVSLTPSLLWTSRAEILPVGIATVAGDGGVGRVPLLVSGCASRDRILFHDQREAGGCEGKMGTEESFGVDPRKLSSGPMWGDP